jgi:hypothetical protein
MEDAAHYRSLRSGSWLVQLTLLTLAFFVLCDVESARGQQATSAIAPYAGTWRATTYNRALDSVIVTWRWVQRTDSAGTLTFGDEGPNPTRVVFASADSLVFDLLVPLRFGAGHPLDGARQRYVARVRGDSLTGTSWTTVVDGRRGQRPFRGIRLNAIR